MEQGRERRATSRVHCLEEVRLLLGLGFERCRSKEENDSHKKEKPLAVMACLFEGLHF